MSEGLDRREVSFAQAEGVEGLPTQLQLKQLSVELRSYLWKVIFDSFQESIDYERRVYPRSYYFVTPWRDIFRDWWIKKLHKFIDEFGNSYESWTDRIKNIFVIGDYIEIFDFVQFVLRHPKCPYQLESTLNTALVEGHSAYRIEDKTVIPITSESDAEVISTAFKAAKEAGFEGATSHLKKAGEELTHGNWSDSVRESIHAVESALRIVESTKSTLSSALVAMEKSEKINPNLKRAMNALYDYTSDEEGVRHAKIFDDTRVGEADALYMFGVCSSFITFLKVRFSSGA